jgi:hypothetical protein
MKYEWFLSHFKYNPQTKVVPCLIKVGKNFGEKSCLDTYQEIRSFKLVSPSRSCEKCHSIARK